MGVSPTTVSRILRRAGLHRLDALEPAPPVRRYEREHPGELLHLDIKKLARFQQPGHRVTGNRRQSTPGAGWDYVHVCIDDHSRVGFAQIHPDETGATVTVFLRAAVAYFRDLGVHVTGVMTDNGGGYRSRGFQQCCARLGLRHLYTRTLYATHEREGGTLHPNRPPRMGIRPRLPHVRPARRSPDAVAPSIQLASTAWQSQPSVPH